MTISIIHLCATMTHSSQREHLIGGAVIVGTFAVPVVGPFIGSFLFIGGMIGGAVAGGNAGLKIAEKVNKKMND